MKKIFLLTCMLLCVGLSVWGQDNNEEESFLIQVKGKEDKPIPMKKEAGDNIVYSALVTDYERKGISFKIIDANSDIILENEEGGYFVIGEESDLYHIYYIAILKDSEDDWELDTLEKCKPVQLSVNLQTSEGKPFELSGESVELRVECKGGNPNGWTYSWKEEGIEIPNSNTNSLYIEHERDKTIREIKAIVTNIAEEGDTLFTKEVSFWINEKHSIEFYDEDNQIGIDEGINITWSGENGKRITVKSSGNWEVGYHDEWIEVFDPVNNDKEYGSLEFEVKKNEDLEERSGSIELKIGNESFYLKIKQSPAKVEIGYLDKETLNFKAIGGTETIRVEDTNVKWVTDQNDNESTWVKIEENPNADSNNLFNITVTPCDKEDGRDTTLVIYAVDKNDKKIQNENGEFITHKIEVHQNGKFAIKSVTPKFEGEYKDAAFCSNDGGWHVIKGTEVCRYDVEVVNFDNSYKVSYTFDGMPGKELSNIDVKDGILSVPVSKFLEETKTYYFKVTIEGEDKDIIIIAHDNPNVIDSKEMSLYSEGLDVNAIYEDDKELSIITTPFDSEFAVWQYKWYVNDEYRSTDENYTINVSGFDFNKDNIVKVVVSFNLKQAPEEKSSKWFQTQEYYYKFMFPCTFKLYVDSDSTDVVSGYTVPVTVKCDRGYDYKDIIGACSYLSGQSDGKFLFKAPKVDDKTTYTLEIQKVSGKEVKSNKVDIKVWPIPDFSTWKDGVVLSDSVRNKNVKKGIRDGNTIIVPRNIDVNTVKGVKGGYTGPSCKFDVEWELEDKEFDGKINIAPKGPKQVKLKAVLKNKKGNQTMCSDSCEWDFMVYPKPEINNLKFVLKGKGDSKGKSKTWIINDVNVNSDERLYVFENDSTFEITSYVERKWFNLPDSFEGKNVFICVVHFYNDDVQITSDGYEPTENFETSCKPFSWDGSSYDKESNIFTRGISETTNIDNHETMRGKSAKEMYTINGAKTTTMTRGLNIIRMEDGTVKKVFKK